MVKVQDVADQVDFLGAALDSCGSELVRNVDSMYYAERDYRRVMLGGDSIVDQFSKAGVQGVRQVLLDWAASFRSAVDPTARDWSSDIAQCLVFVISFPNGGKRLTVDLPSKLCRDELCGQWGRSPARLQGWPSTSVQARLTAQ